MIADAYQARPGDGAAMQILRVRDGVDEAVSPLQLQSGYRLIWVERGYGELEIDFIGYRLSANRIYLTVPRQVHRWRDNVFQGRIFTFVEGLVDPPTREQLAFGCGLHGWAGSRPMIELANRAASELITLGNLLEGECHSDPADWSVIRPLLNAFALVLARTARDARLTGGGAYDKRVAGLLRLVDEHHVVERSAQFYADEIGLSASRLNQISRRHLGRTVAQLAHDRLVLEARRGLAVSDADVQAIGHRLGFDDPSYFTRFFRRETGQTPNQFRDAVQVTPQPSLPFDQAV